MGDLLIILWFFLIDGDVNIKYHWKFLGRSIFSEDYSEWGNYFVLYKLLICYDIIVMFILLMSTLVFCKLCEIYHSRIFHF